jgi:hypothetical protein
MVATRTRIGQLVTTIQNDFLDVPGLGLTLGQAIQRFAVDKVTCEALLGVLVDAGVLARDHADRYIRYYPPQRTAAA